MNKQAFAPSGGPTPVVGFRIIFSKEVNERIEKIPHQPIIAVGDSKGPRKDETTAES
ncbi:hypothetical protein [Anoxybacteroides rupiense]|uniref:hypothetical protein n=1 Tax=Anoxybacteroides rupiense TaxID=311460 RepID=UPI003FA57CA7